MSIKDRAVAVINKFKQLSIPKKVLIFMVTAIIVVGILIAVGVIPKETIFPVTTPTPIANDPIALPATMMDLRSATTYQDDPSIFDKQAPVNDLSFVNSTTGRPWSECGHYAHVWWGVDLGSVVNVSYIILQSRNDCCEKRLQGVEIYLGSVAGTYDGNNVVKTNINVQSNKSLKVNINTSGRYLYIRRPHQSTANSETNGLTVCKLYVFSK